jgi:hypothetical protein
LLACALIFGVDAFDPRFQNEKLPPLSGLDNQPLNKLFEVFTNPQIS